MSKLQTSCEINFGVQSCTGTGSAFTCQSQGQSAQSINDLRSFPPNRTILSSPLGIIPTPEQNRGLAASSNWIPPTEWSWRDKGGNKISNVKNQGQCGCCWAYAATSSLSDRFGLAFNMEFPELSTAWAVMCIGTSNVNDGGMFTNPICAADQCRLGGSIVAAACGFANMGAKLEKCYPNVNITVNKESDPVPACPSSTTCCSPIEDNQAFKIDRSSIRAVLALKSDVVDVDLTKHLIKSEIYHNGPVSASFKVYEIEFQLDYYKGQLEVAGTWEEVPVYIPKIGTGSPGGHAVVITGWGVKDGQEYWEVRNSWGLRGPSARQNTDLPSKAGYFKYGIVNDDPCHLWIPQMISSEIAYMNGGVVTFTPAGQLPNHYQKRKATGKPKPPGHVDYPDDNNSNKKGGGSFFSFTNKDGSLNWPFLLTLFIVASLVVIVTIMLINWRRK